MKRKILPIIMILAISTALLAGCSKKDAEDNKNKDGYTHISGKEAAEFVENAEKDNAKIVDVRGEVAWGMGHLPNAIPVWYEDFDKGEVKELPDKNQKILLYCDYGGLSKRVAKRLAKQGYTNVYEFNGLKVWKGEVIVEEEYKDLQESESN